MIVKITIYMVLVIALVITCLTLTDIQSNTPSAVPEIIRTPTMLEEACCDPDPYTRAFGCDRMAMESLCQQNYTEFCNVTVDCSEVYR